MQRTASFHLFLPRLIAGLILVLLIMPLSKSQSILTTTTNDPFPESSYLTTNEGPERFALVNNGTPSSILVSESDYTGVLKMAKLFQKDLTRVSGKEAELIIGEKNKSDNLIIVGTLGKNNIIDQLEKEGKIDVAELKGKWEQFLIFQLNSL